MTISGFERKSPLSTQARPMRIVFLDRPTLSEQTRFRAPQFVHELESYGQTELGEVATRIAKAAVVIVNKVRIDDAGAGERRRFAPDRSGRDQDRQY
jgi:hypothetical protein